MNQVVIKTAQEIALMQQSGQLLARVFAMLDDFIAVGQTTMAINQQVENYIRNTLHARPASLGQYDYPYVLNCSINDVVCHGMPSEQRVVKSSDIINIDITLEKNGFIADSSKMYVMPDAPAHARKLVDATYQAMMLAIQAVKPGARLGDIGFAIQRYVQQQGYSVVRDYCGHGIGREMHEEPQVMHYGKAGTGLVLEPGMTFTIEPMINEGGHRTRVKKDGWTVVTRDKKLSAQWEHTVLVTASGCEILTLRAEERAL